MHQWVLNILWSYLVRLDCVLLQWVATVQSWRDDGNGDSWIISICDILIRNDCNMSCKLCQDASQKTFYCRYWQPLSTHLATGTSAPSVGETMFTRRVAYCTTGNYSGLCFVWVERQLNVSKPVVDCTKISIVFHQQVVPEVDLWVVCIFDVFDAKWSADKCLWVCL